MDLSSYLLTDEMASDFETLSKMTDADETNAFKAYQKERFRNKTPEEQEFKAQKVAESLRNMCDRFDELSREVSESKRTG